MSVCVCVLIGCRSTEAGGGGGGESVIESHIRLSTGRQSPVQHRPAPAAPCRLSPPRAPPVPPVPARAAPSCTGRPVPPVTASRPHPAAPPRPPVPAPVPCVRHHRTRVSCRIGELLMQLQQTQSAAAQISVTTSAEYWQSLKPSARSAP